MRFISLLAALFIAFTGSVAHANQPMQLSANATGQVLLFPYYTVRDSNTLVSLVNTTDKGKAVRVNFREGRSGLVAFRVNVYLAPFDTWTSALITTATTAAIVSADKSCTSPKIPAQGGVPFALGDATSQAVDWADRAREGYIEVIEMATVRPQTATAKAITHVSGTPPCPASISGIDTEPAAAQLAPPSGGLTGNVSFMGFMAGMLAGGPPVAIDNFWATGPGAPTPRVYAANLPLPDLTSGKNAWAALSAVPDSGVATSNPDLSIGTAPPSPDQLPQTYLSRFATSIDAVSALLTQQLVTTEYATTEDGVIATTLLMTFPTKPYYIHADNTAMFSTKWDAATAQSCDSYQVWSTDRESGVFVINDDYPERPPPRPIPGACFVTNPVSVNVMSYSPTAGVDASFLRSKIARNIFGQQNSGAQVHTVGKEGGWMNINWLNSQAVVTPVETLTHRVDDTGKLVAVPVRIKLPGLPLIGVTLSQSAYRAGTPQQNFADATPLRLRKVAVPLP